MVRRDGYELAYVEYLGNNIEVEHREHLLPADTLLVRDDNRFYVFVPKKAEWMGDGLPPVGTACECMLVGGSDEWVPCEIIAHKDNQAVCWVDCNRITASTGTRIRPSARQSRSLREERENSIRTMMDDAGNPEAILTLALLGRLYDAGYRKQAAK